jgi:hypothetical protein
MNSKTETSNSLESRPDKTPRVVSGQSARRAPSPPVKPSSAHSRHHSGADLHPRTWWAWVKTQRTVEESSAVRVGGRRVSESESRNLHRWRNGSSLSLWSADEFCVAHGLSVNDYFSWARARKRRAWAVRQPWFEHPLTRADWEVICRDWPLPPSQTEAGANSVPDELVRAA